MKVKSLAKKTAFYLAIIVVWQGLYSANIWPPSIFPSPYNVGQTLWYGAIDGSLWLGIGTSLWRLAAGFAIAAFGGIALGIFMARVQTVNETIGSIILGLQSIPSVACRR